MVPLWQSGDSPQQVTMNGDAAWNAGIDFDLTGIQLENEYNGDIPIITDAGDIELMGRSHQGPGLSERLRAFHTQSSDPAAFDVPKPFYAAAGLERVDHPVAWNNELQFQQPPGGTQDASVLSHTPYIPIDLVSLGSERSYVSRSDHPSATYPTRDTSTIPPTIWSNPSVRDFHLSPHDCLSSTHSGLTPPSSQQLGIPSDSPASIFRHNSDGISLATGYYSEGQPLMRQPSNASLGSSGSLQSPSSTRSPYLSVWPTSFDMSRTSSRPEPRVSPIIEEGANHQSMDMLNAPPPSPLAIKVEWTTGLFNTPAISAPPTHTPPPRPQVQSVWDPPSSPYVESPQAWGIIKSLDSNSPLSPRCHFAEPMLSRPRQTPNLQPPKPTNPTEDVPPFPQLIAPFARPINHVTAPVLKTEPDCNSSDNVSSHNHMVPTTPTEAKKARGRREGPLNAEQKRNANEARNKKTVCQECKRRHAGCIRDRGPDQPCRQCRSANPVRRPHLRCVNAFFKHVAAEGPIHTPKSVQLGSGQTHIPRVPLLGPVLLSELISQLDELSHQFDIKVKRADGVEIFTIDTGACARWLRRVEMRLEGGSLDWAGALEREVFVKDDWKDCLRLEIDTPINMVAAWSDLDHACFKFKPKNPSPLVSEVHPDDQGTLISAQITAILHRAFELAAYEELESRLFEVAERKLTETSGPQVLLQHLNEIMMVLRRTFTTNPEPATADRAGKILTSLCYYYDNLNRKLNPPRHMRARGELMAETMAPDLDLSITEGSRTRTRNARHSSYIGPSRGGALRAERHRRNEVSSFY